jgi:two-component system cell cycle sensor histidine kinase/response regulator CckA
MGDEETRRTPLPSWYAAQRPGGPASPDAGPDTDPGAVHRDLFEGFIGGISAGVVVIDSRTGQLVYVNAAMARILDAEPQAILGSDYLGHVAPEDRERIGDYHRRRIQGDPTLPERYEMLLSTRTGERRVVDIEIAPVRFSDVLMVLMRDVTEEKLFHEPLVHMQKMAGMSDLVGRIAHEFNNLLASVLGHTSLLRSRIGDDGDLDVLVRHVEQATRKAREVMGQLLELGGGRASFFDRIPGGALAERLEQVLEGVGGAEDLRVSLHIAEEPWPVRGDLNLLMQAILELVGNAADALGGRGRIRVRLENLDLSERTAAPAGAPPGQVLAVSVEDDGPGIPRALRTRVVEPYFTTREAAGHDGLGLTRVFNTARQFDGAMEIDESPFGGARVTLFIPRGPAPGANLPVILDAGAGRSPEELVLVVDDQEYIGEMIQQMLESRDVVVRSMSDPREAFAAVRDGVVRPTLLIVDARMPGMDGRELALRVRTLLPELPIVMTSGYTGSTAMDGEAAGVLSGFIQKPFTMDALLGVVLPLLGRES